MGAWGFSAYESDQALDEILSRIQGPITENLKATYDECRLAVEENYFDYINGLRGVTYSIYEIFHHWNEFFADDDFVRLYEDAVMLIKSCIDAYAEDWTEPEQFKTIANIEVEKMLKWIHSFERYKD